MAGNEANIGQQTLHPRWSMGTISAEWRSRSSANVLLKDIQHWGWIKPTISDYTILGDEPKYSPSIFMSTSGSHISNYCFFWPSRSMWILGPKDFFGLTFLSWLCLKIWYPIPASDWSSWMTIHWKEIPHSQVLQPVAPLVIWQIWKFRVKVAHLPVKNSDSVIFHSKLLD